MSTQNPLALVANTLRQFGEQGNALVQGIANQGATAASGLLRTAASGAPGLPGLPGIAGTGNGNGQNGGAGPPGLPTPAALGQVLRPLVQFEQAVLPRGVPGPAAALMTATRGVNGGPVPVPPAVAVDPRISGAPITPGVEGLNGAGSRRAAGVQLS